MGCSAGDTTAATQHANIINLNGVTTYVQYSLNFRILMLSSPGLLCSSITINTMVACGCSMYLQY